LREKWLFLATSGEIEIEKGEVSVEWDLNVEAGEAWVVATFCCVVRWSDIKELMQFFNQTSLPSTHNRKKLAEN
jgi:hypothetical protein